MPCLEKHFLICGFSERALPHLHPSYAVWNVGKAGPWQTVTDAGVSLEVTAASDWWLNQYIPALGRFFRKQLDTWGHIIIAWPPQANLISIFKSSKRSSSLNKCKPFAQVPMSGCWQHLTLTAVSELVCCLTGHPVLHTKHAQNIPPSNTQNMLFTPGRTCQGWAGGETSDQASLTFTLYCHSQIWHPICSTLTCQFERFQQGHLARGN